ncbi:PKD domain-containing protein [Micromonospora siamensis]|uniref:PKD domain-containing protein n=1 Tax=Micromonospora siamensis TaxID=299152 RepID=A0A1C5GYZ0_9ACTN|nr:PKD domain-containing protein [Micromonospora siamensis]SCG39022.1 PKD domain-containing protein [Micromonospora siamensis]
MRRSSLARRTALAVAGLSLLAATPAHAAAPVDRAGVVDSAARGALADAAGPQVDLDITMDLQSLRVSLIGYHSQPGDAPITSYRATFGDGTAETSDSPVFSHNYTEPGEYQVSLTATDAEGRSDSATRTVSVLRWLSRGYLLARSNLRYLSPLTEGSGLQAYRYGAEFLAKVDFADAGNGQVAMYWYGQPGYLTADVDGSGQVGTGAPNVLRGGRFAMIRNRDGSYSVRAGSGRYLSTSGSGGLVLANKTTISRFEQFQRVDAADGNRQFVARANGRYVNASKTASPPLIANATQGLVGQTFDLVAFGGGQYALFARANNRFVTADASGTKPLVNTKVVPLTWERFVLVRNSDGSVSLRSVGNGRYVTAESAGAKPLIARAGRIGAWEQYSLRHR